MAKKSHQQGKGPTQRQLRVGEVIRRRLAEILSRADVHDPELNRMSITVSEVRSSPDLKIATAFVMPLGGKDEEAALAALRRNKTELRRLLSKDLTLKFLPDLRFVLDATFDRMDETRRLLAEPRVQADVRAVDTPAVPDEGA
ncbi:MAG: 30S ribosome-binding factor RbfA [Pararhodobacter sp.]